MDPARGRGKGADFLSPFTIIIIICDKEIHPEELVQEFALKVQACYWIEI